MVFSSMVFLWIFLPVVFLLSLVIRKPKYQNILLLIASLLFYAWGEPRYIFLLLFSVLLNWGFGLLIDRSRNAAADGKRLSPEASGSNPGSMAEDGINKRINEEKDKKAPAGMSASTDAAVEKAPAQSTEEKKSSPRGGRAKMFLILDVLVNLGLLGYFKYTDFFISTVNAIVPSLNLPLANIALPIGISFFTFQAMSYVIDLYRGQIKVQKNLLYLALYVSFFPQLIAGPIVKYRDIEAQIENRQVTLTGISSGIRRFIYGLGKKVIISNLIGLAADNLYGLQTSQLTGGMAWLCAITYTLQIYYDFSGYSDMAIGLGRMFGFEFLENFNYPYISASIREFWRRWHISLSSWFRDYLYIPLGGNRKGKARTYLNLLIVFFATGMWHGASWTFILWGLYHGMFMILERIGFGKILERSKVLSRVYTMLVVMVGWVFFRAGTLRQALSICKRMFLFWRYRTTDAALGAAVNKQAVIAMVLGILGCGLLQSCFAGKPGSKVADKWRGSAFEAVWLAIVLIESLLLLSGNTYNPFIYFRF